MKSMLLAVLAGLLFVLLESSLWSAPWLVIFSWQVSRTLSWEQSIWLALILGVILDVLLVMPVGLSSLVILGMLLVFWFERNWFASSFRVDVLFLLLSCLLWIFWRGQSWLSAFVLLGLTLLSLNLFATRYKGVSLRRL